MDLYEVREWMDALNAVLREEHPGMDPAADHRARVEAEMRRLFG